MMRRAAVWTLAVVLLKSTGASADEISVGGVIDARFISTDTEKAWLDGGLGKGRYGSLDGKRDSLVRLSQLSVFAKGDVAGDLSAQVQLNVDAEPSGPPVATHNPVGLIEGFLTYHPDFSPNVRMRVRAGVFFPPVSMENIGPAWTSPYTITSSAANSWIGEEVRATGGEATLVLARSHDRDQLWVTGAGFGGNDPAGTLLAWRGWALQDRQTAYGDRLPIAPIPSLAPGGIHAGHAPYVQPFREIDGRLGWYASAGVRRSGVIEVRGIYWDNRGDADTFDGYQHAWATHFGNVGVHLYLPGRVELIGQHLWGDTQIGSYTSAPVDAYFRTTYGLASVQFGRHRVSARYDDFRTEDEDPTSIQLLDPLTERGHAWTAAYGLTIADKHRLAIEALSIESNRTVRTLLGLAAHDTNFVVQASLRLVF